MNENEFLDSRGNPLNPKAIYNIDNRKTHYLFSKIVPTTKGGMAYFNPQNDSWKLNNDPAEFILPKGDVALLVKPFTKSELEELLQKSGNSKCLGEKAC